jgi:signal transduction histidine kinase
VQELECVLPGSVYTVVVISATRLPQVEANAYMSVVITDITERKRAEKAKDEFISLASHQLRTPATGVKQYLGMLLEGYAGDLSDSHRTFITTAYNSNEKQLAIINSILRTAQIDSGVYKLKKAPQNLAALVDMVLVDFQPVILMREQLIVCSIDELIEVDVDATEISVALTNIVENASKYSPNGTQITISATQTKRATRISIRDQGVGIDSVDQDKIFEKFTRIDNALSDTVNGSGLGLYWVKRIIEIHGGSIRLTSSMGKGTTFTVLLPR